MRLGQPVTVLFYLAGTEEVEAGRFAEVSGSRHAYNLKIGDAIGARRSARWSTYNMADTAQTTPIENN